MRGQVSLASRIKYKIDFKSLAKDLLRILPVLVLALIVFKLLNARGLEKTNILVIWLGYFCLAVCLTRAVFENQPQGQNLDGRSQQIHIINSFFVTGLSCVLIAYDMGILAAILVVSLTFLIARALGQWIK